MPYRPPGGLPRRLGRARRRYRRTELDSRSLAHILGAAGVRSGRRHRPIRSAWCLTSEAARGDPFRHRADRIRRRRAAMRPPESSFGAHFPLRNVSRRVAGEARRRRSGAGRSARRLTCTGRRGTDVRRRADRLRRLGEPPSTLGRAIAGGSILKGLAGPHAPLEVRGAASAEPVGPDITEKIFQNRRGYTPRRPARV